MAGYLGLFCGPMYSGKTSKILTLSNQFDKIGVSNVIINHASDTRYTAKSELVSHDGVRKQCILSSTLGEYHDPDRETTVEAFFINEGQFFSDIVDWTTRMVNFPNCKKVYISGLDADYQRKEFGNWLSLLPFADSIEKLKSVCGVCRDKPSVFSMRNVKNTEQVLVGSTVYTPVCRKCYETNCVKELKLHCSDDIKDD